MSGVGFNTGAAAGGFMQAFLAAQNLKLRREWYKYLMDRKPTTPPVNGAAQALADGKAAYDKKQLDAQAGPTGAGPAKGSLSSNGIETGKLVQAELTKRGVDPGVAAGVVGSMMGESGTGLDPHSTAKADGADGSDSVGIANWNGVRAQNLYKFAGTNDLSKIPPATQAAFVGSELDNTPFGKATLTALKGAKSGDLAAGNEIWTRQYEIPRNPDAQVAARLPFAQQFLEATQPAAVGKVATAVDVAKDNAEGAADIARREQAPVVPGATPKAPTEAIPTSGPAVNAPPVAPATEPAPVPANVPVPPPRPVTPESSAPVLPVQAIPDDQAGDYSPATAAARGGIVQRYSRGGPVKAYDAGGDVGDDNFEYQSQRELAMADQPPAAGPALESPAAQPLDDVPAQGVQVASNSAIHLPHIPGGMGHIPAGGGSMPRMPSERAAPAQKGPLLPDVAPDDMTPQISAPDGSLAPSASNAIQGGISYIARGLRGSTGGAIPDSAASGAALQAFHQGDHALDKDTMDAVLNKADPDNSLDSSLRNIAGLEAVHKYYLSHNDPVSADRAAASILVYCRETAAQYGDEAIKRFYKGNSTEGLKSLVKGYDQIPDGKTVTAQENKNGTATIAQLDMQGEIVWKETLGPQQIMSAAIGLKDGTLYWKLLSEAAAKQDPQGQAQQAQANQVDPDKLFGGGPKAGVPAAQGATPSATPPSATPEAIPTQPVTPGSNSTPVQNAAIPAPVAQGATPPAGGTTAVQTPSQPQQTAIPVGPTAPDMGAPNAAEAGSPTLPPTIIPERTQEYQLRAKALDQQYLAPAREKDPMNTFNRQYLNTLSPANQKLGMQQLAQLRAQWQKEVWEPAMNAYNGSLRDTAVGIHSDAAAAAADKRSQIAAIAAEKRAQVNTERDAERNELSKNRDAQRAMRDKPISDDETQKANVALYSAFSPGVTDPKAAASSFGKLFDAPTATALRDTAVDIARWNVVPADTAASSGEMLVRPKGDMDSLPFSAKPLKNADDMVKVTFKSNSLMPSMVMPKERLLALMSIRANLIAQVEGRAEDARRRGVAGDKLETDWQTHEKKVEDKLAVPSAAPVAPRGYVPVIDRQPPVPPQAPRTAIPTSPESSIWDNLKNAIGSGAIGGNDADRLRSGG